MCAVYTIQAVHLSYKSQQIQHGKAKTLFYGLSKQTLFFTGPKAYLFHLLIKMVGDIDIRQNQKNTMSKIFL